MTAEESLDGEMEAKIAELKRLPLKSGVEALANQLDSEPRATRGEMIKAVLIRIGPEMLVGAIEILVVATPDVAMQTIAALGDVLNANHIDRLIAEIKRCRRLIDTDKRKEMLDALSGMFGKCMERIGDDHMARKEYPQAIQAYHTALVRGGAHNLSVRTMLGKCLEKAGDAHLAQKEYLEAISAYKIALERGVDNPSVRLKRGMAFDMLGKPGDALWEFKAALALEKYVDNKADLYFRIGISHLKLGKYANAKEDFAAAVWKGPDIPIYREYLALACCFLGDTKGAIEELKKSLHLFPKHEEFRVMLNELREKGRTSLQDQVRLKIEKLPQTFSNPRGFITDVNL